MRRTELRFWEKQMGKLSKGHEKKSSEGERREVGWRGRPGDGEKPETVWRKVGRDGEQVWERRWKTEEKRRKSMFCSLCGRDGPVVPDFSLTDLWSNDLLLHKHSPTYSLSQLQWLPLDVPCCTHATKQQEEQCMFYFFFSVARGVLKCRDSICAHSPSNSGANKRWHRGPDQDMFYQKPKPMIYYRTQKNLLEQSCAELCNHLFFFTHGCTSGFNNSLNALDPLHLDHVNTVSQYSTAPSVDCLHII